MEFTLTIDLDKLSGERGHEVARILRYWAGAIKAADLEPGSAMNVYDPHFHRVGRWQVSAATPVAEEPEPEALVERAAPPEPPGAERTAPAEAPVAERVAPPEPPSSPADRAE